jgi:hypothetical protein
VSQPAIAKGNEYDMTRLSKGKSPVAKMITRGKRHILWYQHKTQGARSIIWLKKRLPKVEALTKIQVRKRIAQFLSKS